MAECAAVLLIELPQREIGGQLPDWDDLVAQTELARSHGTALRLDGARLLECLPHYVKTAIESEFAPPGQRRPRRFARKVDAERWLKISEAETLTGRWVDPAAGAAPFGPYAEEWIRVKGSTVGESTATNTEALLRARVIPEFSGKRLKHITLQMCADGWQR